ncbi:hypothetical protein [Haloarcula marina]|uniref:hypothetical protein n=1 Tax=Haloarcula marina TaxID=2961574 RepID=UPI0020B7E129|nr:hypothetical protein [Halomicroarcula marina]
MYLITYKNGTKLHRSVDTGEELDSSEFGNHGYPDDTLTDRLASGKASLDHEFEWDRQHTTGDDA